MLEAEGVVHVQRGSRRQLIWHPGVRDPEDEPPLVADVSRYSMLRDLLRNSSESWISTDYLIRNADFDPHLREPGRGEPLSTDRDLPANYFHDTGKSARKYVLGALKCLYWRESVAWRLYSSQAVSWRWIATGGKSRPLSDGIPFIVALPGEERVDNGLSVSCPPRDGAFTCA
jgi:hypothetical protein